MEFEATVFAIREIHAHITYVGMMEDLGTWWPSAVERVDSPLLQQTVFASLARSLRHAHRVIVEYSLRAKLSRRDSGTPNRHLQAVQDALRPFSKSETRTLQAN